MKPSIITPSKSDIYQGMIDFIGLTSHHINIIVALMKTGEFDTVTFPFNRTLKRKH